MNPFIQTITSSQAKYRNRSFLKICEKKKVSTLLKELEELEQFRLQTDNLYERVRACLFLYAAYRFVLPTYTTIPSVGKLAYKGVEDIMTRRFEDAIQVFRANAKLSGTVASALAEAYHQRAFQILAEQVKKSVRTTAGNQWMFRGGYTEEHPIRIHSSLLKLSEQTALFPILEEKTSVRMDLTCLLYTSPSPRDQRGSRMPSSA